MCGFSEITQEKHSPQSLVRSTEQTSASHGEAHPWSSQVTRHSSVFAQAFLANEDAALGVETLF